MFVEGGLFSEVLCEFYRMIFCFLWIFMFVELLGLLDDYVVVLCFSYVLWMDMLDEILFWLVSEGRFWSKVVFVV